jgi:hypothetical protein
MRVLFPTESAKQLDLVTAMASGLAVALGLSVMVTTVFSVSQNSSALPFWDQWGFVGDYALIKDKVFGLGLLNQHNEHRIALPRLFFILDYEIFHGTNKSLIWLNMLLQLMNVMFVISFCKNIRDKFVCFLVFGCVAALLFSYSQSENFDWGFQIQFIGVFTSILAGIYLMCKLESFIASKNGGSIIPIISIAALLTMASFTLSSGIMAWPIVIWLGLYFRRPRKEVTILLAASLLNVTLYMNGYVKPASHTSVDWLINNPISVLTYILVYFGSPASVIGVSASIICGSVAVLLAAGSVLLIAKNDRVNPYLMGMLAVVMFVMIMGLMTAAGRASFGLAQAASSRYITPVSIMWAALIVFWLMVADQKMEKVRLRIVASVAIIPVFAIVLTGHISGLPSANETFLRRSLAADAILSRVTAPEILKISYPDPKVVMELRDVLKYEKISIFSEQVAQLSGQRISDHFRVVELDRCQGSLDGASRLSNGELSVGGWVWGNRDKKSSVRIVITDNSDRILGYGTSGHRRDDVPRAIPEVTSTQVGWVGFLPSPVSGARAFAVLQGGRTVCRVGQPKDLGK